MTSLKPLATLLRGVADDGAANERAAIVKFLRYDADILAQSPNRLDQRAAEAIGECAEAIEHGDHLK